MIPDQLIRWKGETNEQFCWRLFEEFQANPEQIRFSYNYEKDGEMCFSKHLTLMDLWHTDPDDKLEQTKYHDTRTQFFQKIQHRTILPCEIMFDIDDKMLGKHYQFPSIRDKSFWIFKKLCHQHDLKPVMYFTQNKSYHISCIVPELIRMNKNRRRACREELINRYSCDLMKACDGTTIALEGSIHYRSGKEKILVRA